MEPDTQLTPNEKRARPDQDQSPSRTEMTENTRVGDGDFYKTLAEAPNSRLNALFENPLSNLPRERLLEDVDNFCKQYGLEDHLEDFRKGALAAQNPSAVQDLNELTEEDKAALMLEHTHKWSQPWQLYWLVSEYSTTLYSFGFCLHEIPSHVFDGCCRSRNG
jgi:hypothetical protein